jgi:hypothetical protein
MNKNEFITSFKKYYFDNLSYYFNHKKPNLLQKTIFIYDYLLRIVWFDFFLYHSFLNPILVLTTCSLLFYLFATKN